MVTGLATKFPDLNNDLWLVDIGFETISFCSWFLTDGPSGMALRLDLLPTSEVGWDHEYTWRAVVTQALLADTFDVEIRWNDADLPVPRAFQPSCDAAFQLLNSDTIPKQFDIFPVPDWICDQDQAREWAAGV